MFLLIIAFNVLVTYHISNHTFHSVAAQGFWMGGGVRIQFGNVKWGQAKKQSKNIQILKINMDGAKANLFIIISEFGISFAHALVRVHSR